MKQHKAERAATTEQPSRAAKLADDLKQSWPGALSGLLVWMSFPPLDWSWLAWVALVPLITLVRSPWNSRPIYKSAWVGGLIFGLCSVHWIRYADDSGLTGYNGWFGLALYLSLYFPAFLLVARIAVLRFSVPVIFAVPIVWVGFEHLRSWLLTGFPWYYLGHSQYKWLPFIQMADVVGAYGLSFVVAMFNGWLADLIGLPLARRGTSGVRIAPAQLWRGAWMLLVFGVALGYGKSRIRDDFELGPRVALVQTNLSQQVKIDSKQLNVVEQHTKDMLAQAVRERPQLIIWPETSFLRSLVSIESDVQDADLARLYPDLEGGPNQIREYSKKIADWLGSYTKAAQVPMLVGLNWEQVKTTGSWLFNTAVIVYPSGSMSAPYHKIHLVPWGEYLPLRDWMPWLRILTPHASAEYGLDSGHDPVRFEWEGYTFGVLICFEDTLPWGARQYLKRDAHGGPVDFLVNISNDGWFAGSSELDVHLAISLFRAVESRRALVRAVNTGISAIIDSNGRIVQAAGLPGRRKLISDVVAGSIPLDDRQSLYVRVGDWLLAIPCFILTVACLVSGFLSAAWKRRVVEQRDT